MGDILTIEDLQIHVFLEFLLVIFVVDCWFEVRSVFDCSICFLTSVHITLFFGLLFSFLAWWCTILRPLYVFVLLVHIYCVSIYALILLCTYLLLVIGFYQYDFTLCTRTIPVSIRFYEFVAVPFWYWYFIPELFRYCDSPTTAIFLILCKIF